MVPGSLNFEIYENTFKLLEEVTGGRMVVEPLGAGTLVGSSETLEALGEGLFEAAFLFSPSFSGLDPGFGVLGSLPGVWESSEEYLLWEDFFGGRELYAKAYGEYNVHFLNAMTGTPEPFMSKWPINTLEDFKGMKLRTPEGPTTELFSLLGAVPLYLPGGEIYGALQTGLIDGAEFITITTNYDRGLHEVTGYILYPSFHGVVAAGGYSVNMDKWNELPDDIKRAWELVTIKHAYRDAKSIQVVRDNESLQKMLDYGVVRTQLPIEDWLTINALGLEVAESWAAKSDLANEVITSIFDFKKALGKM